MAARETRSLSFSRGLRFMGSFRFLSVLPDPGKRAPPEVFENARDLAAEAVRVRRCRADDELAVPGRGGQPGKGAAEGGKTVFGPWPHERDGDERGRPRQPRGIAARKIGGRQPQGLDENRRALAGDDAAVDEV